MIALGVLLLALIKGLDALYDGSEFRRDDIRGLVAQIEGDLGENDALLVSAAGLQEVLSYYYAGAAPVYALPTTADDEQTRSQVREIIAAHQHLHVILYGAAEQDPNRIVETTLNTEAFEISDGWVDDLRYVQYISPLPLSEPQPTDLSFGTEITLQSFALSSDTLAAGDALQVQLVWSAREKPSQRYKVFLQLLNADGASGGTARLGALSRLQPDHCLAARRTDCGQSRAADSARIAGRRLYLDRRTLRHQRCKCAFARRWKYIR